MGDADDGDVVATWELLHEALGSLSRRLAEALDHDGSVGEAWTAVLIRLRRSPAGQLSAATLASRLSLTDTAAVKLLDRLDQAGLIERISDAADERVLYVRLTERGWAAAAAVHERLTTALRSFLLAPVGDQGVADLTHLARRIRDHNERP